MLFLFDPNMTSVLEMRDNPDIIIRANDIIKEAVIDLTPDMIIGVQMQMDLNNTLDPLIIIGKNAKN